MGKRNRERNRRKRAQRAAQAQAVTPVTPSSKSRKRQRSVSPSSMAPQPQEPEVAAVAAAAVSHSGPNYMGTSTATATTATATATATIMPATSPTPWLSDEEGVDRWLAQYDVVELLAQSGGLVRIDNFLPREAAAEALRIVKSLSPQRWSVRADEDDPGKNSTKHHFEVASPEHGAGSQFQLQGVKNPKRKSKKSMSTEVAKAQDPLALVTRALHRLLPEKRVVLSAGRYACGDLISEHDDHAYVVEPDGVRCSRDVAVVYYLTPEDWSAEDGGVLVDLQTGARLVPRFNSLVAFMVPRMHEVTAVVARKGRGPRLSVFGWFLYEGDLYNYVPEEGQELQEEEEEEEEEEGEESRRIKRRRKRTKS